MLAIYCLRYKLISMKVLVGGVVEFGIFPVFLDYNSDEEFVLSNDFKLITLCMT